MKTVCWIRVEIDHDDEIDADRYLDDTLDDGTFQDAITEKAGDRDEGDDSAFEIVATLTGDDPERMSAQAADVTGSGIVRVQCSKCDRSEMVPRSGAEDAICGNCGGSRRIVE